MQVGIACGPCHAHTGNDLPLFDLSSGFGINFFQMPIKGIEAWAVVHHQISAIVQIVAGSPNPDDFSRCTGVNRGAPRSFEIDSRVSRAVGLKIVIGIAEIIAELSCDRLGPIVGQRRARDRDGWELGFARCVDTGLQEKGQTEE